MSLLYIVKTDLYFSNSLSLLKVDISFISSIVKPYGTWSGTSTITVSSNFLAFSNLSNNKPIILSNSIWVDK